MLTHYVTPTFDLIYELIGIGGLISVKRKGSKYIWCWIDYMTLAWTLTTPMTLIWCLQRSDIRNDRADGHGTKGMWVGHSLPWASYQMRKIAGSACAGNAGNVSLATAG